MNRRGSGVLLHITSLPSRFGIGDLGPEAYRFADFLAAAGQSHWQILPLNPTDPHYDSSPYHSLSAFAFSTLLISPEDLCAGGLCRESDLADLPDESASTADYSRAAAAKEGVFRVAYETFLSRPGDGSFERFCAENSDWLDDFAMFKAIKAHFGGRAWSEWPTEIMERRPVDLRALEERLRREIEEAKFLQFVFFKQWSALRSYCRERGIRIIGDMPIYVDYDSADVWTNPELFELDERKKPIAVAGVPPDYFSETGQLWGNPLYRWDVQKKMGFEWWIRRMRHNLRLFDLVRVDHFRGFVGYWRVPAGEKTAVNGKWMDAPAGELFRALREKIDPLAIIAEDLGTITPDVKDVMARFGFPGMKVLLFAFGEDNPLHPYLPHTYERNCIVYTGTHDNATARGWLEHEASPEAKRRLFRYLGREVAPESVGWELARLAAMSVADLAIIPVQDLLGLGREARMNCPASSAGNWKWRLRAGALDDRLAARMAEVALTYGRIQPKEQQVGPPVDSQPTSTSL
jgi:4-alpha-glucanotransferase